MRRPPRRGEGVLHVQPDRLRAERGCHVIDLGFESGGPQGLRQDGQAEWRQDARLQDVSGDCRRHDEKNPPHVAGIRAGPGGPVHMQTAERHGARGSPESAGRGRAGWNLLRAAGIGGARHPVRFCPVRHARPGRAEVSSTSLRSSGTKHTARPAGLAETMATVGPSSSSSGELAVPGFRKSVPSTQAAAATWS
jgi:hypothetical protein